MQACLSWTLGKDFFGIKVERPLRSLVIQAENDLGDMSESFQDICNGLGFDSAERGLIADNLAIFRESVATGPEFGKVMRRLITEHRADIVFVDPLMAYSGCDLSETSEASAFLRHVIQPILDETGVIIVFMHHTGKPKSKADSEGQTTADLAYQMFGSSEITNWAREVATLVRCQGDEPIYRLALTKRRGRAGLTDINTQPSGQIYIRHSPKQGEIRWVRSFAPTPPPKDSDYSPAKGSPRRSDY
jgi:RecA-family ATPase